MGPFLNPRIVKTLLATMFFCCAIIVSGQQNKLNIQMKKGHAIELGSSGFNVRIADKIWNYTHPDFRKAVHELRPGWLRYFSGTMGDAFNTATGQYDLDYAYMFDKSKQYLIGHQFTEIKGPHRISDLYALLGEINGKLIVTVNAFSETPEITRELVRFIKNNDIEVELWQFCNEPYFYVPHRERYWWNNGRDYAAKMKPHADEILKVFPEANLALNFTWDGIWGFMKEINQYQRENGAFWNTFSKHSYAPHVGRKESVADAYRRGNTKLLEATGKRAMAEIEAYTEEGIPMAITEFGVWNRSLNGIYSSVYNIEYVMRQLQHPNTRFVGAHEVSNKYVPEKNLDHLVIQAFEEGRKLNTDSLSTGVKKTLEGKAFEIFHRVTNNVDWIYPVQIEDGFEVPGLKGQVHEAGFAQAYSGVDGYDYLVVTNRSEKSGDFQITLDGTPLKKKLETHFISAPDISRQDAEIQSESKLEGEVLIRPFSITVIRWKSRLPQVPSKPRIYDLSVTEKGVKVDWGPIPNVDEYHIVYGTNSKNLNKSIKVSVGTSMEIEKVERNQRYFFAIYAENYQGKSEASKIVSIINDTPKSPKLFKTAIRDNSATIMWQSVPFANGYLLKYVSNAGEETVIDVKNVFGYRVEGLEFNKPYEFSVASYNGMGKSAFSKAVTIIPKKNIPFSPRNVSAKETKNQAIKISWVPNKLNPEQTEYIVLRGKKPHEFEVLEEGVKENSFLDTNIDPGKKYFYTVKAKTEGGESNFYPNIATPIELSDAYTIEITNVIEGDSEYHFEIEYQNVHLDGYHSMGLVYNNISYLNVEETKITAVREDKNRSKFEVVIPKNKLRKGSRYAIKPYINTNGKDLFGQSDKIITVE